MANMTSSNGQSAPGSEPSVLTSAVTVVTVNFRTPRLTCDCLDSVALERTHLPRLNMIVVDNFSEDGSFEQIDAHVRERGYDWAVVIASPENRGYAAGNNIAIDQIRRQQSLPDYVWLLNPDTKLRPGAGAILVTFLQKNGVHIAGSRLENEDGTAQASSFNFPTPLSEFCNGVRFGLIDRLLARFRVVRRIADRPEPTGWLAGASLLLSREMVENVGRMDDDYFLYFEEVDYCLTARRRGYVAWYVPESRVYHAVGASTGISKGIKHPPRRPQYWFDSRHRYFVKNHGAVVAMLADFAFVLGYSLWLLRRTVTSRADFDKVPPRFLADFVRNTTFFRGFSLRASS